MKNLEIFILLLVTIQIKAMAIVEPPPQEYKLADSIPFLKEHLPNLFIDSTLYESPALPYRGKNDTEAMLYCMGFCLANDLKFSEKAGFVLMQANDIARVIYLPGDLTEQTIETLTSLEWDLIPHRGQYIVEYPIGHQDIIDNILKLQNEQIKIQLIITNVTNRILKDKGIAFDEYINGYINFFDFFTLKDSSKWQSIQAGFRVDLSRKDIEEILTDTTTLISTSILGKPSLNAITQSIPYETFQRDQNGLVTERSIEFIEAGLTLQISTSKMKEKYLSEFQIEVSNLSSNNELPVVSKRQSSSVILLEKNKPILVASLFLNQMAGSERKGLFGKATKSENQSDQIHIFAKLIQ